MRHTRVGVVFPVPSMGGTGILFVGGYSGLPAMGRAGELMMGDFRGRLFGGVRLVFALVLITSLALTTLPSVAGAVEEGPGEADSPELQMPATEDSGADVVVLDSDGASTVLDVVVRSVDEQSIQADGQSFQSLSLSGYGSTAEVGKPELPVIREVIAVPDGATITATVTDSSYSTSPGYRVYPVQEPEVDGGPVAGFTIDEGFYSVDAFYPQGIVEIDEPGIWRDLTVVGVQVNPVQYNPATGEVRVYDHVQLRLDYTGGSMAPKTVAPSFARMYESAILNYDSLDITEAYETYEDHEGAYDTAAAIPELDGAELDGTPYDTSIKFLSIRNDSCSDWSTLKPLLEWHKKEGLPYVSLVYSTTPTAADVKDDIEYYYNNYGIEYVLLVGDISYIPWQQNWGGGAWPNDLPGDQWYACITGSPDMYADVAIGRLSVTSDAQLQQQIDKILEYAQSPPAGIWANRAVLMAHREGAPGKYQGCLEEIRTATYSDSFTFWTEYGAAAAQGGDDATNADVTSDVNTGVGILNYRGHGGDGATYGPPYGEFWGTNWNTSYEEYTVTQAHGLANGDYTPVVFSISCTNAWLDAANEVLGEAYVKDSDSAVAFLGASRPSYTTPNHDFDKNLFDAIGNEYITRLGWVLNDANAELVASYGSTSYAMDNVKMYLWLGDPALDLWTGSPQTLVVDHPTAVMTTMDVTVQDVLANPVANALVCLYKYGDIYTYGYTNALGEASFSFSPSTDGVMDIVVTKHNYYPYEGTVDVVPLDNSITNIAFSPSSPYSLCNSDHVVMTFDYSTDEGDEVRVQVTPFTNGSPSPNYGWSGCSELPYPEGSGSVWFTILSGDTTVDEVRVRLCRSDWSVLIEFFAPVDYTFGRSIESIAMDPVSPATLVFGEPVNIDFDYYTCESSGVRIFVTPYTSGSPTPNYFASGSDLYPQGSGSGSGWFTIDTGSVTVDQVLFEMTDAAQTVTLLDFFVDVQYDYASPPDIWAEPTGIDIELYPDSNWGGTLRIGNNGETALEYSLADVETTGGPFFDWVTITPDPLPQGTSGTLTAQVHDPDGLGDIAWVRWWVTVNPTDGLYMYDDGAHGDGAAGDGVYGSGVFGTTFYGEEVPLTFQAGDTAGNLGHTSYAIQLTDSGGDAATDQLASGVPAVDVEPATPPESGDGTAPDISSNDEASPSSAGGEGGAVDSPGFADIHFSYDLQAATGEIQSLGVEFDGTYFYVTGGNSGGDPNKVYVFDRKGDYYYSFDQDPAYSSPGWGWRDLAWDGTYLYGSDSTNIVQFQTNGIVVDTIPGPGINPCRGLAYDAATDHFWTAGFNTGIYEIDRAGTVINTFSSNYAIYGLAWDNACPDGPWLWVFAQEGSPAVTVYQFDPVAGVYTGVSFTSVGDVAGGACFTTELEPPYGILAVVGQGFPDRLVGHEVCQLDCDWMDEWPSTGTVPAYTYDEVEISIDSSGLVAGEYTAEIHIANNDPDEDPTIIPVKLTVVPEPNVWVDPPVVEVEMLPQSGWSGTLAIGNSGEGTLNFNVVDVETTGGPCFDWVAQDPDPLPWGSSGKIEAQVHDPDGLGDIDYVKIWFTEYPSYWTYMNDSGTVPDAVAGDGIYTCTTPGVYPSEDFGLMLQARDLAGNLGHISMEFHAELAPAAASMGADPTDWDGGDWNLDVVRPLAVRDAPMGGETDEVVPAGSAETSSSGGNEGTDAPGFSDIRFTYDVEGSSGDYQCLGVEFDGTRFYVTGGNSGGEPGAPNKVHMFDRAGYYLGSFDQDPLYSNPYDWGWRDLAWDGMYLYGSGSSYIYQFETDGTVVGNITGPGISPCRGLAYDPATDHFWVVDWASDIYEIERTGAIVNQYANAHLVYGLAWDDVSPGGPWLWTFAQEGSPAATVYQFDPVAGVYTGVSFSSTGIAAGSCFTTELEPPYGVLVALNQGSPDMLVGHEICQLDCDWLYEWPDSDSVMPASVGGVELNIDTHGMEQGEYTAEVFIESDDPDEDPRVVVVQLTVLPVPNIDVEPRGIDITLPPDTTWNAPIVMLNNGDEDSELGYQMVDTETTGGPFIKWAKSVPNPIPQGDGAALMAEVTDPDGLADVDSVRFWVTMSPGDGSYMHDDGAWPDEVAGDGIYTASVGGASMYGPEFGVTIEATDMGGSVCHITHVQRIVLSDVGEASGSYSGRSDLDAAEGFEFLYWEEVAVAEGEVNAEGVTSAVKAAYTWGDVDGGSRNILVYADDTFVEPGQSYVERALRFLGLAYTCYYADYDGFGAALTGGSWDLVLVSHNTYFQLGNWWSEIEDYVNAGGTVVLETFDIDGSNSEATTLWDTLGVSQSSDMSSPEPLYRWQLAHPIFQGIETLSDLSTYTLEYGDNGDKCDAVGPTLSVAGFTASPTAGQGGVFSGSIVNSFIISNFRSDDDGDGRLDAVELWKNEIMYSMFGSDCDWLDESPTEGFLPYNGSDNVMLTIDTSGLALGEYSAEIYIASNDLDEGVTFVPVRLTVAPPIQTGRVLFDETHDPAVSVGSTFGHWIELLRAWGFVVDRETTVPTTYGELLDGYCAVVIPEPTEDYTDDEIAALEDYVDNGGGLLVMGEYGWWAQSSGVFPVVNELADPFGMWFNDDTVYDDLHNDGYSFWPIVPHFDASVVGSNVDEIVEYAGCSVGTTGPAFPIAWGYSSAFTIADGDSVGDAAASGEGLPGGDVQAAARPVAENEEQDNNDIGEVNPSTGEVFAPASEAVELTPLLETDGGYDVLWDLTHGVSLGYEPSNRYSSLASLLGSAGYTVHTTTSGVESVDLGNYAVLVVCLGSAWTTAYTAGEVAAIEEFVQNGGGLLVLGDNTDCPNANINPVAQEFGTTCGLSYLSPPDLYIWDMDGHPIFDGVSEFYLRAAGELGVVSPSQEVAWTPSDGGEPVVSVAEAGAGRVVVVGDFNLWDNDYIVNSQNQLLAENTFNWLAEPSQPGPPVMAASLFGDGRAMIIGDSNLFRPLDTDDDSPGALYEYDNHALALNIIDWLCQPWPDLEIVEKWEDPAAPRKHLHSIEEPPLYPGKPIEKPVGTDWHELYPDYCNKYEIDGWKELTPDGVLSPGDIVSLEGVDHAVEDLTATMFVTPDGGDQIALELTRGYDHVMGAVANPEGTYWYRVYPDAFEDYLVAKWKDGGDTGLSAGDLILLVDVETGAEISCDVDEVAWDLIVSPILEETPNSYVVCYQVANTGDEVAPAGHSVTLYVDGMKVEHKVVPVDLAPDGTYIDCFRTVVECTLNQDVVVVCADNYDQVNELREFNNCAENIYVCPCEPSIDVQKMVWDECSETWVEVACVPVESAATFRVIVENTSDCCDLVYMEVSDWLVLGLAYVPGSATVNGVPTEPMGEDPLTWNLELAPVPPGGNVTIVFDAMVVDWGADPFGNLVEVQAWCEGNPTPAAGGDDAAVQPCILGDANMNGNVNMQDVTYIELIILGYLDPTCGADANQNCTINMGDVTTTELIILGYL